MLAAPFKTLDDSYSIVANPYTRDISNIKEIFTRGYFNDRSYYRPLVNLSFMGEYHAFGLTPFFYNLDNLLLHLINAFLVWALIFLITENVAVGFWAALLFVLHPIHAEAVANISGRAILLGGAFGLSALIFFLLYEKRGALRFLWPSLICFALGLLCKESVAVLPGVIFCYLWFKKRPVYRLWPWALVLGAYICLRVSLHMTETYGWRNITEHSLGFLTFLRSLLTDARLFIWPVGLHFDRSQELFLSFKDPGLLMTIFIWAVVLMWGYIGRRQIKPLVWFCLAWFTLEMFPVSQIVTTIGVSPGVISSADHFLYLASIPIFVILIELVKDLWLLNQQQRWVNADAFKTTITAFFVFLFVINIEQNIYARSELSMLERSIQIQPNNARLQSSVGLIYAHNKKFTQAEGYFAKAVAMDPWNARYKISLATSLCDQGRYKECLDLYDQIKDPGPFKDLLAANKKKALINQDVGLLQK